MLGYYTVPCRTRTYIQLCLIRRSIYSTRSTRKRRDWQPGTRMLTRDTQMEGVGYDPSFLGPNHRVPLPEFSDSLVNDVLSAETMPETIFQETYYTRYIHFSVATNKARRQPIVVGLNIDQSKLRAVKRGRWSLDEQVGDYQLSNAYYRNNDYDRGHLARRASAAWGDTEEQASEASDATMVYSNAALQHAGFNQDEWLALESWVFELKLDSTDRISVFSGPIYTNRRGIRKSIGSPPATIPTAFFKVVCFVDRDDKLATRAFIMAQDRDAISDKNARRRRFDLGAYQVPVTVIEEETGLLFDDAVKQANPLGSINDEPQIMPVTEDTVVNIGNEKSGVPMYPAVFILAAMINPEGTDRGNEWLTIANFGAEDLNLEGWKISTGRRARALLSGVVPSGEARKVSDIEGVRLTNTNGMIILIDPDDNIVDRVAYSERSHKLVENVPILFHNDDDERETGLRQ